MTQKTHQSNEMRVARAVVEKLRPSLELFKLHVPTEQELRGLIGRDSQASFEQVILEGDTLVCTACGTTSPATAAVGVQDDMARDAKRYRTWRDAMLNESDEEMARIQTLLPGDSNGLRKPTAGEWGAVLDAIARTVAADAQSAEGGKEKA